MRNYTTAAEREHARDKRLARIEEQQDLIMLALGMKAPDYPPAERDPWADDFEEATR